MLTLLAMIAPVPARAQDVMTDYPDYYPGDVVVMTGTGWWPGERISLRLDQHPTLHDPFVFYATADSTGAFRNSDYIVQDQDLGTSFDLTATGLSSGLVATTFFTDSPKVGSVSVGAQTGTLCGGSSNSATYEVTVTRGSGGGSSGSFTARLSLAGDSRPGITAVFSPLFLSFSPGQTSRTAIMTITTDSSTPTGSWGFYVMASTSQNDNAIGAGLLEVGGKPTVTCPADITLPNEPGKGGAVVTFAGFAQGSPTPFLTYSDAPGSFFPVGTTTVDVSATNACGAVGCQFHVTVLDVEPPSITVSDITTSAGPGVCTAYVALLGATVHDNCPGASLAGTRSDGAPLPAAFPGGVTTITWTATDAHGNTATATQHVTVNDTEKPTITAPAGLNLATGAGAASCGLEIPDAALGTPTAHDNCGVTVERTGVPVGNLFPVGTTTITYTANDPSGNSSSATQMVTVTDDTPPSIMVANIARDTDPGACSAGIASLGAEASDNCAIASLTGTRSDGAALGDPFPKGMTTIAWLATDIHGNTATATQTVTVTDRESPKVTAADLSVSTDPGSCAATIASLGAAATDNCGTPTLTGTRSDGAPLTDIFPRGTITIEWLATDASGNTAGATQHVTVSDTEHPTLTAPASLNLTTG
ncbi:MAG: HYR domain-containing protein, partial [Bacteroidota bacterium]